MSKNRFTILALIIGSVIATAWLLLFDGTDMAVAWFWRIHEWVQLNPLAASGVFFLMSFVSQLIVMPSGSLMLLVAGFALGGLTATGIFAAAQVLAAWPVYRLSAYALTSLERRLANEKKGSRVAQVRRRLALLKGNDVLATALLRLTPVIPSAGACVLASVSGIRLPAFLFGTVLTCWIRPLFFASSGQALSEVALRGSASEVLGGLNLWPLLLLFLSVLFLFVLKGWLRIRAGSDW